MQNVTELRDELLAIQRAVDREYDTGVEDEQAALCHILHRELGLGTTKPDDETLAAQVEQIKALTGEDVDEDVIDLTVEHHELHDLLRQIKLEAVVSGLPIEQVFASLLIWGRRLGLREAAAMLGITDDEASDGPVAE